MCEGQTRCLLSLFALLEVLWRLRVICTLLLVEDMSLVEVGKGTFTHVFAVLHDAELRGPGSHLLDCLLERGDVVVVHLAYLLVDVNYLARLSVIEVALSKYRSGRLLETLV